VPAPGERLVLEPATAHHVEVVTRITRDEPFVVFDGHGAQAVVVLVGSGEIEGRSEPPPAAVRAVLHLVLAVPKGPALDHALRMAVELGVTHVHPGIATRSVVREVRTDRWLRIVASAVAQSGRADLPVLAAPAPLLDAAAGVPATVARRLALPGAPRLEPAFGPAALIVGPEGGFTSAEVDVLIAAGWVPGGLATHVLRVDTAVAAGLALLAPR
jgi:16S rRNA (uracil1498-N3)-methyltransferase